MRVFCHVHKRGFFAPRQSPIKCENRGHIIGELDFTGEARTSLPFQWQYCCNCEHFCVINFEDTGLHSCPVCTRRSSTLYLCDRCHTISFESNTPLQTKNFTLSTEGVPLPCCPGCLQPTSVDLHEHACDEAHISFVTGLNVCPICNDRLDVGPAFPSPVAQYLRRTKAANKVYATFDYDSGLFVSVEDGEFVLVTIKGDQDRTIVLPRSAKLESRRDFYELYQDYYYCADPVEGEINILEPATVVETPQGWKLLNRGSFKVHQQHPTTPKRPVAEPAPPPPPPQIIERPEPEQQQLKAEESGDANCSKCGTLIEGKYAFCWKCGQPRANLHASEERTHREHSRLVVPMAEFEENEEEEGPTVQHEGQPGYGRNLLWATATNGQQQTGHNRSVLKLFSLGLVGLLLISLMLFVLWPSNTSVTTAAPAETVAPTVEAPQTNPQATASVEIKPASMETPLPNVPDNELERLRRMRNTARGADPKMLKDFSETEKKFADDYRFPYERAKVAVMVRSYGKAFLALNRAAHKAINAGKSREMLQSLVKDSEGDFQALTHGHPEWDQLQKALKSRNPSVLSDTQGL
jgi:hypothetical protein